MDEKKNIEVVSGDGSNLDISPVYEHLNTPKSSDEKPKNIIIPEEKPRQDEKKNEKEDEEKVEENEDTDKNEEKKD